MTTAVNRHKQIARYAVATYIVVAGLLGYLTHLVMTSDENPGSNSSLSPPSPPPQPSNVPISPLLPPSALPIPHYLSSLAEGWIGMAMLCCLSCLGIVGGSQMRETTEFKDLLRLLLVLYNACFSLFILLGLMQDFKK